jgi:hypothetical protein
MKSISIFSTIIIYLFLSTTVSALSPSKTNIKKSLKQLNRTEAKHTETDLKIEPWMLNTETFYTEQPLALENWMTQIDTFATAESGDENLALESWMSNIASFAVAETEKELELEGWMCNTNTFFTNHLALIHSFQANY